MMFMLTSSGPDNQDIHTLTHTQSHFARRVDVIHTIIILLSYYPSPVRQDIRLATPELSCYPLMQPAVALKDRQLFIHCCTMLPPPVALECRVPISTLHYRWLLCVAISTQNRLDVCPPPPFALALNRSFVEQFVRGAIRSWSNSFVEQSFVDRSLIIKLPCSS